jgi:hypothetical protein
MSQPGSPAPILAAAQAEPLPELSQMLDTLPLPGTCHALHIRCVTGLRETHGSAAW